MARWIASFNRENWAVVKNKNIWGVPKRNQKVIARVKPGDTIVFFVSQKRTGDSMLPSAITGIYEVISEPYEDHSHIFVTPQRMVSEEFPYRVKIRPLIVLEEPLEFKPLILDLEFIKNKIMWSGHLRAAMREIPEEDYQFILKKAEIGV